MFNRYLETIEQLRRENRELRGELCVLQTENKQLDMRNQSLEIEILKAYKSAEASSNQLEEVRKKNRMLTGENIKFRAVLEYMAHAAKVNGHTGGNKI